MKQIITIEIEEEGSKRYDYATLIMLAVFDKKEALMATSTKENEADRRKIAVECEKLIHAVAIAKVERK
jgi:hypothetical protein